jgi:hypothetical protein
LHSKLANLLKAAKNVSDLLLKGLGTTRLFFILKVLLKSYEKIIKIKNGLYKD